MATLAEFTVAGETFPLGSLFIDFPDVRVELERVVPTTRSIVPYIWVKGADQAEETKLEAMGKQDPGIQEIKLIDEVAGNYLLRIVWNQDLDGVMEAINKMDVTLISGVGMRGTWTFEIRSESREAISEFQQYCKDHGVEISVKSLYDLSSMTVGSEFHLTDSQREALVLAYERGYYQSPREVSLDELATEVGITGQSFGSRLQRGIHRLIGSALLDSER